MNGSYTHDLNGVTRLEIVGWPGGAKNAVISETSGSNRVTIEVDVAEGEYWTYSKNNHPVLRVFSNNKTKRVERHMVVIVPSGKKDLVHFVA
ncbi:MAG TPA: hypothetical protein VFO38_05600 [Candidatus Saccharimonadales bacterium]|nr:hypothetical protein [Candidatus Saccharimonadales bacterium]